MSLKKLERGIYYTVGKMDDGNIVQGCSKDCKYCHKYYGPHNIESRCENPEITKHFGRVLVEHPIAITSCMLIYDSRIL